MIENCSWENNYCLHSFFCKLSFSYAISLYAVNLCKTWSCGYLPSLKVNSTIDFIYHKVNYGVTILILSMYYMFALINRIYSSLITIWWNLIAWDVHTKHLSISWNLCLSKNHGNIIFIAAFVQAKAEHTQSHKL